MLKSSYFCGGSLLAVVLAISANSSAYAQASTVEEVVVTGSFIAGTPEDAALPVEVMRRFEARPRKNNSSDAPRHAFPHAIQYIFHSVLSSTFPAPHGMYGII